MQHDLAAALYPTASLRSLIDKNDFNVYVWTSRHKSSIEILKYTTALTHREMCNSLVEKTSLSKYYSHNHDWEVSEMASTKGGVMLFIVL